MGDFAALPGAWLVYMTIATAFAFGWVSFEDTVVSFLIVMTALLHFTHAEVRRDD